jgi:hypothetical protein
MASADSLLNAAGLRATPGGRQRLLAARRQQQEPAGVRLHHLQQTVQGHVKETLELVGRGQPLAHPVKHR